MLKLKLVTLLWCVTLCCGIQSQLGIYSNTDCTGDALIFESKQPDLTFFAPILATSQSWSAIGCWGLYNYINYGDPIDHYPLYSCVEYRNCYNNRTEVRPLKSVRYLGPPDTTTHSISFYEMEFYKGREVTITGPASTNIPFTPKALFTTGNTSWTFYSGTDFDGTATCFTPQGNNWFYSMATLSPDFSNVRSIYRGCNRHIDHYI